MKKCLALLLVTLAFLVSLPVMSSAAGPLPFKDVPEGKWFFDSVASAYEKGLMNGTSADLFEPNGRMSRAMFVTVLGRMCPDEKHESTDFSDVKSGKWYSEFVGWAAEHGIVGGYSDGTFKPDRFLTREEAAAIIVRYIDYVNINPVWDPDSPEKFSDKSTISSWAAEYVEGLRESGIIAGDSAKRFNPKNTLTRAEAATIFVRMDNAFDRLAVEEEAKYDYRSDKIDGYVLGAWDIYYSGSALKTSYAATDVTVDGMPKLVGRSDGRKILVKATVGERNKKGLVDPYDGNGIGYSLDLDTLGIPAEYGIAVVVTDGGRQMLSTGGTRVMKIESDSDFGIYCVAFFRSEDDAEKFDENDFADSFAAPSDAVKLTPVSAGIEKSLNDEADRRKAEILNSENLITPADVEGTCYYVSSIHGNDKNDGLSPETAWKTASKLVDVRAGGLVRIQVAKPGDGVFFERGSTFGPSLSTNAAGDYCLLAQSGVKYGAYGVGAKPVFSAGHDLSDESLWEKTGYEGVWRCTETFKGTDITPSYNDIGNIIFDDELWGVKIYTEGNKLGDGVLAVDLGIVTNGRDTYAVDGLEMKNVGSMNGELMYFQDYSTGELFLRCSKGNPGSVFDKIIASPRGDVIKLPEPENGEMTCLDNLVTKYSGADGIFFETNAKITNCECYFTGGCFQGDGITDMTRFGNAIGNYGDCEKVLVENCYVYGVYDSGLSVQVSSGVMKNVIFRNNVIENANMSVEIFNGDALDGALTENVFVSDNIIRNAGYGLGSTTPQTERKGTFMMGQIGNACAPTRNFVFENNTCLYSANMSSETLDYSCGERGSGLIFRDNTYLVNSELAFHANGYERLLENGGNGRTFYPYTAQYLTYLSRMGIDRGSTFYGYTGYLNDAEKNGAYRLPIVNVK